MTRVRKCETTVVPSARLASPIQTGFDNCSSPESVAAESRRFSMAYSSFSDGSFSTSSPVSSFSPPMTPVHGISHGTDHLSPEWLRDSDQKTHACLQIAASEPCFDLSHWPFTGVSHAVASDASFDPCSLPGQGDLAFKYDWPYAPGSSIDVNLNTSLTTTLFPQIYSPEINSTSISHIHSTSPIAIPRAAGKPSPALQCSAARHATHLAEHSQSQVVLPSHLSPETKYVTAAHRSSRVPNINQPGQLNDSFDSFASDLNNWNLAQPSSPPATYSVTADQDSDSILLSSPSPFPLGHIKTPIRQPRRQISKRSRRRAASTSQKPAWYESFGSQPSDCHIRLEGRPFTLSLDSEHRIRGVAPAGPPPPHSHKTFVCADCGTRFARGEHLKRHRVMHSDDRPYPCPLPRCGRRIGRSDNACDHFKTHLRPRTKGKRNETYPWPVLEACILREYPGKQAQKLLENLRKWMAVEADGWGMLSSSSGGGGGGRGELTIGGALM